MRISGLPVFLTWNLWTATAPSDSDLTANGVTLRAKVMELKTATTVKAWTRKWQTEIVTSLHLFPKAKKQPDEMEKFLTDWWLAQIYNKLVSNEGQSGNRPWTQWIQVPTATYLSCREVIAQSHMQGESAHAWYHHNYGSHAHCEALDNPGSLQHPPLLGSHLCWREKSESQRQTEPERKQTKLSDLQSVLKVNNEHHKSR